MKGYSVKCEVESVKCKDAEDADAANVRGVEPVQLEQYLVLQKQEGLQLAEASFLDMARR